MESPLEHILSSLSQLRPEHFIYILIISVFLIPFSIYRYRNWRRFRLTLDSDGKWRPSHEVALKKGTKEQQEKALKMLGVTREELLGKDTGKGRKP